MTLTAEQARVAQASGRRIRVVAYAGTGKTASLVAWAQAHPLARTIYLAFNKSVQYEAQHRFPRTVAAKTGHALGYRAVGVRYQHKLVPGIRPWELVQAGVIPGVPPTAAASWADVVLHTLQRFWVSADDSLGPQHIPLNEADWLGPFAWADPVRAVRDAQRIWARMCDPDDATVGMTHDGYLKLFVQDRPRLPYDVILFDEAQDANPVVLQLVQAQTQARQIFVGDPYQAIYSWRGAVNAMDRLQADQDLRLTASFRFGPAIAEIATQLLRWRHAGVPAVRGLGPQTGRIYAGMGSAPVTFIGRSNARLFAEAVAWLDRDPSVRFAWVGGLDGYRLDLLEDTARLWLGDAVRTPFLQLFGDFDSLTAYADAIEDVEWQGRCRVVERWGKRLPGWVRRVRAASQDPDRATVHLSTIHKAKGLEWPHVVVLDDLAALGPDLTPEDQHLWYVAVTRATQQLGLPDEALDRMRAPLRH